MVGRRRSRMLAIAMAVSVLLGGAMVLGASNAAFTNVTTNSGDAVATGSVVLTNDRGGVASVVVSNLAPGATNDACVNVTYQGTLPAVVVAHGSATGSLASHLSLTVLEGTPSAAPDCTGWTGGDIAYAGTVAGFAAAHTSSASGAGTFSPQGAGVTRGYRFVWTLPATVANSTQGQTAQLNLAWTARNTAATQLQTVGDNSFGSLGHGDTTSRSTFTTVAASGEGWTDVSAGQSHICGIRYPGTLWCWGGNAVGQLGTGGTTSVSVPTRVGVASDWTAVTAGSFTTCGLRAGGELYCWGRNTLGSVGDGSTIQRNSPVRVGTEMWRTATAARDHTCAIRMNNTLWCWGWNEWSQLGDAGSVNSSVPRQVGTAADWTTFSIFTYHGCGLRGLGDLYCWGHNRDAQLGAGPQNNYQPVTRIGTDRWASVQTLPRATCAITLTAQLACWGRGENLAADEAADYLTAFSTVATRVVPTVVDAGVWSSLGRGSATRVDRSQWVWGDNANGQLGRGNTTGPVIGPTALSGPAVGRIGEAVHHVYAPSASSALQHNARILWPG